ncbi:MAG: hypothetical protein J6M20_07360 [Clostridia bacterium]|nr:hypothetical protein [Clostridia bacterium]
MKKRLTTILIALALLMTTTVVTYAITTLFFKGETQTSDYSKKTYFQFAGDGFFTASGEVGPGESMSINPVISSNATVDMYVFIRVEMPMYNGAGLYELNTDSSWECIESGANGDAWFSVYCYNDVVAPGASTTALGSSLTMVDMSLAEYSELSDINVTMTGYACGAEDETLDTAWESIKGNYGL